MASPSHASEYPQYDAQSLLNLQPVIVTVIDPSDPIPEPDRVQ